MLQVTDAAVSVLKSEILHEGEPQQGVTATAIRIRPVATDDGRQSLTLQPVTGPDPHSGAARAGLSARRAIRPSPARPRPSI